MERGRDIGYSDTLLGIGSIGRRIPTCKHPITTHSNGIRVIAEMQGDNRCSADRGQSFDPQAIVCPGEMLVPNLRAWIE